MRRRILLVEGDPTIRKHLAALLARLGYPCCPVASLAAALAEVESETYPLIIVDLDLAGGDPRGVAVRLRTLAPAARLVGLDSAAAASGADPALDAFDAVIAKPFLADPLLAAIPQLLPADA